MRCGHLNLSCFSLKDGYLRVIIDLPLGPGGIPLLRDLVRKSNRRADTPRTKSNATEKNSILLDKVQEEQRLNDKRFSGEDILVDLYYKFARTR